MPILFEILDPMRRKVICTDDVWHSHILTRHPIMRGLENEVKLAIEKPSIGIFQDSSLSSRSIYYLRQTGTPRYLKAVVEFDDNDIGEVITAFLTDAPKSGERLIWP
ncbi:MAG TPA: hypothetical protein VKQ72_04575 [Aggregatilineales bacterium]|nr:hypothetical protein [Aggregatilineales bacterium]